jgi:glycosyltransferase involved in cell wall biosynthesis
MKVGFVSSVTGTAWLGGRNYFRNLFAAIGALDNPKIEIVVFARSNDLALLRTPKSYKIVHTKVDERWTPAWVVRRGIQTISSRDWLLERLLGKHEISVLSHFQPLGKASAIASLGWIPDFQHLHLPDFFSAKERRSLDRNFARLGDYCDRIVVSSANALADLVSFMPRHAGKAVTLPFVAASQPPDLVPELSELQIRYSFDRPYFILPNQFWAHKNHRVVITALKILKDQERPFLVLATGATDDYRNPSFFPSLLGYAKDCGVLDSFRVLGVIPTSDLFSLMRHSIAFINPSRFEGWSTSVEEAKSNGKTILLSDIQVHREQSPEFGVYFHPDDAGGLAQLMQALYQTFDSDADSTNQRRARAQIPENQKRFARNYESIVMAAGLAKQEAGNTSGGHFVRHAR